MWIQSAANKKDLYPRRNTHWIKVLLAMVIVPGPSLATVLTSMGSAMSPADSYSPLWVVTLIELTRTCQAPFFLRASFPVYRKKRR